MNEADHGVGLFPRKTGDPITVRTKPTMYCLDSLRSLSLDIFVSENAQVE
jgi:hypothetical protein